MQLGEGLAPRRPGEPPLPNAPRGEWLTWAAAKGASQDIVRTWVKRQIMAAYGPPRLV